MYTMIIIIIIIIITLGTEFEMLLNLAGPVIVMTSQLVVIQLNHYNTPSHYLILVNATIKIKRKQCQPARTHAHIYMYIYINIHIINLSTFL